MPAGSTYTPIATTRLGSATNQVNFNSISGSYTDLVLICGIFSSTAGNTYLRFNNNSSSIYSRTRLSGSGSAVSSNRVSNTNTGYIDTIATNSPSEVIIVNVMNYSNGQVFKTYLARANNADSGVDATVGLWSSTSAITSISVYTDSGNFSIGSTFTLYGIASA
jgi:hypothetical protein